MNKKKPQFLPYTTYQKLFLMDHRPKWIILYRFEIQKFLMIMLISDFGAFQNLNFQIIDAQLEKSMQMYQNPRNCVFVCVCVCVCVCK
jgi:hypothetical protein